MTITVRYSSIDHFRKTRTFKTIEGARKFAVDRVGADAEFGSSYAVSFDGIGKIEVTGCTLDELFGRTVASTGAFEVWTYIIDEDRGTSRAAKEPRSYATLHEANQEAQRLDEYCDGVHIVGTTDAAKAELAAQKAAFDAQCFMDREIEANPF